MFATLCCYCGAIKDLYFTLAYYFTLTVTLSIHGNSNRSSPQADPGGPILWFLHTFLPKRVCIGGGRPPMENPGSATEYGT